MQRLLHRTRAGLSASTLTSPLYHHHRHAARGCAVALAGLNRAGMSVRHASTKAAGSGADASSSKPNTGEGDTSKPKAQPVEKPPVGKFQKYAKEHGVFFAFYFMFVCEALAWVLTFLVHQRYLFAGDVATLVSALGVSKYVDVDKYADASISVFGWFDLSGRLAMNYAVCSSIAPVGYPALLPLCLMSAPALKRTIFFWRNAAPAAAAAGAKAAKAKV